MAVAITNMSNFLFLYVFFFFQTAVDWEKHRRIQKKTFLTVSEFRQPMRHKSPNNSPSTVTTQF